MNGVRRRSLFYSVQKTISTDQKLLKQFDSIQEPSFVDLITPTDCRI